MTKEVKHDTVVYTVADVSEILSLGKTKTYELMHSDGFPTIRLNNRLYVTKDNFEKWLSRYTNRQFIY